MSTFTNTAREVEMPNGDVVVIHNASTGGENTTSNIKKFKYDDNGHVTESTAADAEDLNLSGYSTPTTGTTAIGASDSVQAAIGKLDHQSQIDQTNILYTLGKTGKNIFDFDAWIDGLTTTRGTFTISGNSITITATDNDCSTDRWNPSSSVSPVFKIPTKAGEVIILQWNADLSQASNGGTVYIFPNGSPASPVWTYASSTKITFTVPSGCEFITFRFGVARSGETITFSNIMICTQEDWNISPDYQPYRGLPNYDLTQMQSEDRAALAEVVDSGAKNKFNLDLRLTDNNCSFVRTGDAVTITATGSYAFVYSTLSIKAGTYTLRAKLSNVTASVSTQIAIGYGLATTSSLIDSKAWNGTDDYLELKFTVATETNYKIYFYANSSNTSYSNVVTFSEIMLCTKAAFDISPAFVPFTLKQPRVIAKRNVGATVSTTETILTDLTFTVPANHIAEISVMQHWANAKPRLIRIATDNTMTDMATIAYTEELTKSFAIIQAYGIINNANNSDQTVYVSAASDSQAGASNLFNALIKIYSV